MLSRMLSQSYTKGTALPRWLLRLWLMLIEVFGDRTAHHFRHRAAGPLAVLVRTSEDINGEPNRYGLHGHLCNVVHVYHR